MNCDNRPDVAQKPAVSFMFYLPWWEHSSPTELAPGNVIRMCHSGHVTQDMCPAEWKAAGRRPSPLTRPHYVKPCTKIPTISCHISLLHREAKGLA